MNKNNIFKKTLKKMTEQNPKNSVAMAKVVLKIAIFISAFCLIATLLYQSWFYLIFIPAVWVLNYIRHEVNSKGHSYSEIGKRINRDYRTVKKYAEQEDFSPEGKTKQDRPSPVMDPVKHIVDEWLLEDFKQKKKFRRTAKRIWELLKEEFHFKGSDRTVRNYVSQRKRELLNESDKAALPLENKPGSAQVDFGEAPFKYQGEQITLPYLVMSYPHSNTFYFQVFPFQNKECFLESMKRIFFGGHSFED